MCTALLQPGDNPITVNKYIIQYCPNLMKFVYSRHVFGRYADIKSNVKSFSCIRTDGQKGRRTDMTKANCHFLQNCEELVTMHSKNTCSVTLSTTYESRSEIMCII